MSFYQVLCLIFWTNAGNTAETYKLADLNVEAQESGDEEDEIDWEEG